MVFQLESVTWASTTSNATNTCAISSYSCTDVGYILFGLVVVHYLACSLLPGWMVYLMSQPFGNHMRWNLGPSGLEFQLVIYETYHRTALGRRSHIMFMIVLEQLAWLVLIAHYVHLETLLFVLGLLCAQVLTFRDHQLSVTLIPVYTILVASAYWLNSFGLLTMLWWAEVIILAGAGVKAVGHTLEGYPPFMLGNLKGWQESGLSYAWKAPLKGLVSTVTGYFSELAVFSLFRFFPVVVHRFLLLASGLRRTPVRISTSFSSWEKTYTIQEIRKLSDVITESGSWQAYLPSARLFASGGREEKKTENEALKVCPPVCPITFNKLVVSPSEKSVCRSATTVLPQKPGSLSQVPMIWKTLFHVELALSLSSAVYFVLIMLNHNSEWASGLDLWSAMAKPRAFSSAYYMFLFLQAIHVVIGLLHWTRLLPGLEFLWSTSADLYSFCNLQEAMVIQDILTVLVGINVKHELSGRGNYNDLTRGLHAQICMASLWLIGRLAFLSKFDIRTIEPLEKL